MSTQTETGQAYAPSASRSTGWMPWTIGAVVAAVAISATLAVGSDFGAGSESVASAELSRSAQADAARLTGLASQSAGNAALSAETARLTGLATQYESAGTGPSADEYATGVLSSAIPGKMQGFIDRLTQQEIQAHTTTVASVSGARRSARVPHRPGFQVEASPSTFSPEAVRVGQVEAGLTGPDIWTKSTKSTFSPEAVRVGQVEAGLTGPDIWTKSAGAGHDSSGPRHQPR